MLSQDTLTLGGLQATITGERDAHTAVLLLHGHSMTPSDLAPFVPAIAAPALYIFPSGPVTVYPGAAAWWPVDMAAKAEALSRGPRDMVDFVPPGMTEAREQLGAFMEAVQRELNPRHVVLGGFSQGAMLACDWTLHNRSSVQALVMLSASRINFTAWSVRSTHLNGLPVLASHGRHDHDLAFEAGERLRDYLSSAGAAVTWVPFDGGHEIPLTAWRALRRFLLNLPCG